jgi:hypothetical protein
MTDETRLARLARQYSHEAIAALVFAIRNSDDARIKVTAALGLLDRAYGRPGQAKPPSPEYTNEDIDAMIQYLEAKYADELAAAGETSTVTPTVPAPSPRQTTAAEAQESHGPLLP